MQLKTGARFRSVVCDTEVIVIKSPDKDLDLQCGGHSMVPSDSDTSRVADAPDDGANGGSPAGKRYADEDLGLEVLVTKGGAGTLSLEGRALDMKKAKRLPSSD